MRRRFTAVLISLLLLTCQVLVVVPADAAVDVAK